MMPALRGLGEPVERVFHRAHARGQRTHSAVTGKLRNLPVSGSTTVIFSPSASGNMLTIRASRANPRKHPPTP